MVVWVIWFTLAEGAEKGVGGGCPEARLAGARVPAGHVDAVRVGAAAVEARGALVHVQLAPRPGETQPATALARQNAHAAILARRLTNRFSPQIKPKSNQNIQFITMHSFNTWFIHSTLNFTSLTALRQISLFSTTFPVHLIQINIQKIRKMHNVKRNYPAI